MSHIRPPEPQPELTLVGRGASLIPAMQLMMVPLGRQLRLDIGGELEFLIDAGRVRRIAPGPRSSLVAFHEAGGERRTIAADDLRPNALIDMFISRYMTRSLELELEVFDTPPSYVANFDLPVHDLVLQIAKRIDEDRS